jgi:ankyrin repeat protein
LYAASSASDTDWVVRLIDVYPDGLAVDVSHGFLRARYRNGLDKPELIESGNVIKYTLRMRPTSNAFLMGHRIRLDITSSDFPNYDRNHNTAFDQYADATLVTAHQTIYHGGEHLTRIVLPWVPNTTVKEQPIEERKPDPKPKEQVYSLHQAAADGDMEQVKLLISKGADVNAGPWTALQTAVEEGRTDIAELLIQNGADINVEENGMPLSHYVLSWGKEDMVELFLAKGADFNWKDKGGVTALHYAAANGQQKITELLLAKDFKVNERDDEYSFTPLHYAARFGHKNVAELLIAKGAAINAKDKWGYQPIHWAAQHDRLNVVELLIVKGADINAKTSLGQTPLQLAQERRNTKTIELLSKHGAQE